MKERTNTGPLLSRRFQLVLLHLAEETRRVLELLGTRRVRALHSLRTRMKNLRALLLLVKPRIQKRARRSVTSLAGVLKDMFSAQRDAHVLDTLRAEYPGLRDARAKKKDAPDGEDRRLDSLAKAQASRLIRTVAKLELTGLAWDDIVGGYLRTYRAGRKAMKACERKPSAKLFHDLRRPVKDLFYQSQALQPLDGMKRRRGAADRLGDRLGELNDLHMLREMSKKSRASEAIRHVEKRQHGLKAAIFRAAAKLFAERPKEIEEALQRCVKFQPGITAQAVRQA